LELKVLLVDDKPELPSDLAVLIFDNGYHVLNIAEIGECFAIIRSHDPDIIILNNFPPNEQLAILQDLKTASGNNCLILVTGEKTVFENRLVSILDAGADSCLLSSPTDWEILAQVNALARVKNIINKLQEN
jgi:DNA-binding response OmpR family regulator